MEPLDFIQQKQWWFAKYANSRLACWGNLSNLLNCLNLKHPKSEIQITLGANTA